MLPLLSAKANQLHLPSLDSCQKIQGTLFLGKSLPESQRHDETPQLHGSCYRSYQLRPASDTSRHWIRVKKYKVHFSLANLCQSRSDMTRRLNCTAHATALIS